METTRLSRRAFLRAASAGAAAAALTPPARASAALTPVAPASAARWKIIGFSKPFTSLSYAATADLVADVGWDGIECPVRKNATHIDPERVEEQLPKMVEALSSRGREVSMITTDITGVSPLAERILGTASKLGIRRYRLGSLHYVANRPIPDQLEEFKARLRDLAQLNSTLGIQGGVQNHSGKDYFGAPVWDAWDAVRNLPPADLGLAFDIGHATLEGGLSWPIQARLVEPRLSVVYVKDFRWERKGTAWEPEWCPVGHGMISPSFFTTLGKSQYQGPICQHHEYDMGRTPAEHLRHFKQDLQTLRGWLASIA